MNRTRKVNIKYCSDVTTDVQLGVNPKNNNNNNCCHFSYIPY